MNTNNHRRFAPLLVLLAFIALGGGFVALEYGLRWHGRSIQGRITASQPDLSPTAEHPTL